jgi:hypothetical protein
MIIPSELTQSTLSEMKEMGMNLNADEIYSSQKPSMNDAVIQFNGGCTGEIVSSTGLLFTNHHCGYGAIQSHSTFEHNYIKDGFWAMSNEEELPNPGMYVTFVRDVQEVTNQVLEGVSNDMDDNIRKSIIQKNINKLQKTLPKKDWQEIEIRSFYAGNKYFAFTNENYYDIRLVGAPPSSIGKFGADTDNWMWPRHSGDFSIFRIYADKNNRPAKYSKDNVPYKTDKFFKISIKPMQPGEFFLVYGFPGRTNEYLPAIAVDKKVNIINPARIETRKIALDVMDAYMQKDDTIKLKYTAKYARIANYWKKWIGESQGINKTNAVKKKKLFEQDFIKKAKEKGLDKSYFGIFEEFKSLYAKNVDAELARNYFIEIAYLNNDLLKRSFAIDRLINLYEKKGKEAFKKQKEKYEKQVAGSFKNYDAKVDKDLFIALMKLYIEKMPKKYADKSLKTGDVENLANNIYAESVLNNQKELIKLYTRNPKKFIKIVSNDPGYQFAKKLIDTYYNKIAPDFGATNIRIAKLQKKYMRGIINTTNVLPYPDANGTLRISYGVVQGYEPHDAVMYFPNSTLKGVMEKYIPGDYEFDVNAKLIDLFEKKDYKPYSNSGFMPVNFLGSAHTTGGNSGSPAINKEGELIGINFDRVWEGTMSDLYYDKKISRNIMVDIRYVLFIIDKLGDDKRLIKELTIVK